MGFFDTVFVFDHFPSELDARPIGVIDQTEHVRRSAAPTANIVEARAQKDATKCWEYRRKNMSAERKKEVTRIHFDMPHSVQTVGFDSKGEDWLDAGNPVQMGVLVKQKPWRRLDSTLGHDLGSSRRASQFTRACSALPQGGGSLLVCLQSKADWISSPRTTWNS